MFGKHRLLGNHRLLTSIILTLLLSAALIIVAHPAHAQTDKVLYSFSGPPGDGSGPYGSLVFDKEGNLYGTTSGGGEHYDGTVFRITVAGTEEVLYSFGTQSGDGYSPESSLVLGKTGNFYGTTYEGGAYGEGTVFEITPAGTEKVLYNFGSQSGDAANGARPWAGLVFDEKGNLYGTTFNGGTFGYGTVFEINKAGGEKVLHSFSGPPGDGSLPLAGLVFDGKGNLYGTTAAGGENGGVFVGGGTVFEITANGRERVLYNFCSQPDCTDGDGPYASVVFDKDGNLYSTTAEGGVTGGGTVFEITASGTEKVLFSFCPHGFPCSDAYNPYSSLIFDKNGNLYGTTYQGGAQGWGTVFGITAAGTEKVIHSFCSQSGCTDGGEPYAGLIFDKEGNLYGAALSGGAYSGGTVFEVTRQRADARLQK